jgi:hypothetical protein
MLLSANQALSGKAKAHLATVGKKGQQKQAFAPISPANLVWLISVSQR